MKALKTVQDLWSHCLFCPICQDVIRDVHVDVGPDDAFQITKFEKNNNILSLYCSFRAFKKKQTVNYHINCLDNSFTTDIGESTPTDDTASDRAARPYFYFYIQSDCKKCNSSHTNGSDLELDMLQSCIANIGIEREGIYLLNEKTKFHITLSYENNEMLISKCFEDENGEILDDNKPFNFPIIDFDFSNQKKVINKIRTLLVFS